MAEQVVNSHFLEAKDALKGVDLSFKDVTLTVKTKEGPKTILNGVSGCMKSGEMLCVLGPSGGGKTSLIQVIAKRINDSASHQVGGTVLCNQQNLSPTKFQRISGLVTQEDVFNGTLTVQETLHFMAQLKLGRVDFKARVAHVVSLLQLDSCLKTLVGDDSSPYTKGISGGEKRRLAIAMEILDPDISMLILDEPTSGLDSAAALNVANVLRSLSDSGMPIAATLHQPRAKIMERFNQLMILAKGRPVFYGACNEYVPFLENDLKCQVPKHDSPYDLLLDALNPAINHEGGDKFDGIGALAGMDPDQDVAELMANLYAESSLGKGMTISSERQDEVRVAAAARAGWLSKFATILVRTFLIKMRDPIVLATQISSAIFMGVIFGIFYWQTYDKEAEYVVLDTQMAVTMTVLMSVFLPYDVTLTFPKERQIFLRERRSGLYTTSVFYCARILADMPFHILAACIMTIITYYMEGLRMGLGICMLLQVGGILVGASLMQLIGAISSSFEEANILLLLLMMFTMMLSSGFVRVVPGWMTWARDISIMGLLGDLCLYYEFADLDPAYGTTDQVLSAAAVRIKSEEDVVSALLIMLGIFLVARFLTFLAVKFMYTGRSFAEDMAD